MTASRRGAGAEVPAAFPAPRFVSSAGVRLAVYEVGSPSDSPSLILSHGFPELAFSWRHQLRALGALGHHVVALDQRGYGLSDRPLEVAAYDMLNLTGDLLAVLDDLGLEQAVFGGHDWGGLVVWDIARRHPSRVAAVIALNTPHRARSPNDPVDDIRARWGDGNYVVQFQQPGVAEAELDADVRRTLEFFLRRSRHAPLAFGPGFPLLDDLRAYRGGGGDQLLGPDEFDYLASIFERTGFVGGLNWYRNISRNWELSAALPDRIDQPVLMIMAEHDAILPPAATAGMDDLVPRLTRHLVRGSGHWTQQEQPEEVSAVMAAWLETTFGNQAALPPEPSA